MGLHALPGQLSKTILSEEYTVAETIEEPQEPQNDTDCDMHKEHAAPHAYLVPARLPGCKC
eukprot:scaffold123774_cov15-Tisochrysis_lutea.AAC.1